jgi:MFS family permease
MVVGSVILLALAVLVESRAAEPTVPLPILRERNTALAILASLAVGMAMFGGAVFLGQYFQIGRGYSPTEAGLLTIPLMAGVLVASIVAGRMVSASGKIKPYIVVGAVVLVAGFALLATVDHGTALWYLGIGMFLIGVGVGMTMQNLVLAVQNSVALKDIGAASSTVAFFRSLGGTIGVSVLGAVLAHRVTDQITHDLAAAGVPASGSASAGGSLNLTGLPAPIVHIVRAAYGDATGHIFLISAVIAVVGVIAAVFLRPVTLRSSLDLPAEVEAAALAADVVDGAPSFDQGAPVRTEKAVSQERGARVRTEKSR